MAVAVVINTAFFEWLRLSTTRFYSDERHASEPGLRATIELGYAAVSLALCAILGAAWAADVELGMPAALLAASTAAGIGMALFDYRGALARARFLERSYAQIVLFKNAAAFLLMVGGAFLFHSPKLVLCGAAASGAAALLVTRRALADPLLRPALAQRRHLRTFAIYAMPLVAANILYQLMPLMNRSALALSADYAEAGKFSLAADLGLRLFMTLGSGLDILLFQIAVRIEAARGRAEAEGQIAHNIGRDGAAAAARRRLLDRPAGARGADGAAGLSRRVRGLRHGPDAGLHGVRSDPVRPQPGVPATPPHRSRDPCRLRRPCRERDPPAAPAAGARADRCRLRAGRRAGSWGDARRGARGPLRRAEASLARARPLRGGGRRDGVRPAAAPRDRAAGARSFRRGDGGNPHLCRLRLSLRHRVAAHHGARAFRAAARGRRAGRVADAPSFQLKSASMSSWVTWPTSSASLGPLRSARFPGARSCRCSPASSLKASRPPQTPIIRSSRSSTNFSTPTILVMRWPVRSWKLQAS